MAFNPFSSPRRGTYAKRLPSSEQEGNSGGLKLDSGSQVAVVGSGPAGSFFSYFLLDLAQRVGIDLQVDIYEPRDFALPGPTGCNMCGGVVSESLVQMLATEGINLPSTVVQRGIGSYMLHTDVGSVRIETPLEEKRIAAVHRGSGPRNIKEVKWTSFDRYLQELAVAKGARLVRDRVDKLTWPDGRPQVKTRGGSSQDYDLLAVAVGVNSAGAKLFQEAIPTYISPRTTKTYICEYPLGEESIRKYLGDSMHVFLLNISRLEFAAVIPKGDYATVCLLGEEIDGPMIKSFLESPAVRACFPPDTPLEPPCHCSPRINIYSAVQPFADRIVFIGDSGVTRLFKDGIGAAYRTAKAAATTAVFHGLSSEDFRQHYLPTCSKIDADNRIGRAIFAVTRLMQKRRHDLRGILRMVSTEQQNKSRAPRMSMVLWDLFTGSAPYREIILRAMHPVFLGRFLWSVIVGNLPLGRAKSLAKTPAKSK
jgi:flavin-dependent dehydrogenase